MKVLFIVLFAACFFSESAKCESFDFNQVDAPSQWLKVKNRYGRTSHSLSSIFEFGASLAVDQFLSANKDWQRKGIASFVYDYDNGVELPGMTSWQEVQLSQAPEIYKDLPTAGMHFIQNRNTKTRFILQVLSNGKSLYLLHDKENKASLPDFEKLLKYFSKAMEVGGVYTGNVIELKPEGVFGFLKEAAKNNFGWKDFIYDPEEAGKIRKKIEGFITQFNFETWKKNNLPMNRGILLHGPPGTGKSFIGKILISNVLHNPKYPEDLTFMQVQARHITNRHSVKKVFDLARRVAPTIVFMEDVDLVAGTHRDHKAEIKNELMQQLSGLEKLNGVITIATTNVADLIDPALKRSKRLTYSFEIGAPGPVERMRLIGLYTKDYVQLSQAELRDLSELSDHMNGADIKEWVQFAMEKRLMEADDKSVLKLEVEDLREAIELKIATTRGTQTGVLEEGK